MTDAMRRLVSGSTTRSERRTVVLSSVFTHVLADTHRGGSFHQVRSALRRKGMPSVPDSRDRVSIPNLGLVYVLVDEMMKRSPALCSPGVRVHRFFLHAADDR